ncbi:MAG: hypothetical protein ACRDQ2_15460, partial [Gaiellales bacterium]
NTSDFVDAGTGGGSVGPGRVVVVDDVDVVAGQIERSWSSGSGSSSARVGDTATAAGKVAVIDAGGDTGRISV